MEIIETSAKDYCAKYAGKKKRTKYNNRKVEYRGEIFDSQKELDRWKELLILQAAGLICNLKRQVEYILEEKQQGQRAIKYKADFIYDEKSIDTLKWGSVIEDCKGYKTAMYKLKKKLMRAKYGITIRES